MAAVFAFLGMLLLSLVVALLAALQLGDFFRAGEEFVPILTVIAIFAAAAIVVFAIAHAVAKRLRAINAIAAALSLLALALAALPSLVERIAERLSDPFAVAPGNTAVALELLVLLVPLLLVVLVQWGLVRRRWLRAAGEEDLSRWPWVTTVIAGLSILNPFGLALVASALQQSASDFMRPYFAAVAAAVIAALVVMAAVECYIRGRILRRRLAASLPPKGGEVATPP
jgi:hypothetical protein